MEVSPQRRSILRAWCNTKDQIRDLNGQKTFMFCERCLGVWNGSETGAYRLDGQEDGRTAVVYNRTEDLGHHHPRQLGRPENKVKKQEDVAEEVDGDEQMKNEEQQAQAQKHPIQEVNQENDTTIANAAKKAKTASSRSLGRTATL